MTEQSINDIIEIFNTPLQGSYNWDYSSIDGRIRKLYKLGKELNWNQEFDLNWSQEFSQDQYPMNESFNPFAGYAPFENLTANKNYVLVGIIKHGRYRNFYTANKGLY